MICGLLRRGQTPCMPEGRGRGSPPFRKGLGGRLFPLALCGLFPFALCGQTRESAPTGKKTRLDFSGESWARTLSAAMWPVPSRDLVHSGFITFPQILPCQTWWGSFSFVSFALSNLFYTLRCTDLGWQFFSLNFSFCWQKYIHNIH